MIILPSCVKTSDSYTSTSSLEETGVFEIDSVYDFTSLALRNADSILYSMTLEERIGQCFMPALKSSSDDQNISKLSRLIKDFHIGGVMLLKGDTASAKNIIKKSAISKIPLFISIDAEQGLGMRLKDAEIYPLNGRIRNDIEEVTIYDYGREISRQSQLIGINMILGPVIDVSTNMKGFIGSRSYGSDPQKVASLGVAYAKGIESGNVISVAKHFPGHGSINTDTHQKKAKTKRGMTLLDSLDLLPFKKYIESGLTGVMVGHIAVEAINDDGMPASLSREILSTLLRDEMKFKGLIVTDAFDMGGIEGHRAWEALEAGADIILNPKNLDEEIQILTDRILKGQMDIRIINDRCWRILFYKSLFDFWNQGEKGFEPIKNFSPKLLMEKEK